jgi:hypothetical protein
VVAYITYGFALTNFSLSIDSESPIYPNYSLEHGRWGTNLIRYHLFNGLFPYYTLLFGLFFLSLTAVEITKIFNFKGIYAYIFCLLFLSFPQHAYQLAFTMQADAVPLAYFMGTLSIAFYLKESKSTLWLCVYSTSSVLLLVATIAVYQILIYVPIIIYIIYFLLQINKSETNLKLEIKKAIIFAGLMIVSVGLYFLSVKLFVEAANGSYLEGYASGNASNPFKAFYNLLLDNIYGLFYYGEKPFLISTICVLISIIWCVKEKRNAWLNIIIFTVLLILPFSMSFFIRNGYHPPRLYVGSTIVFAFTVVFVMQKVSKKFYNQILFISVLIYLWNVFYVTNLYYSLNRIFKHDLEIAKDIKQKIDQFDNFNPVTDYVYFYGCINENHHNKFSLPNSEVFGASILRWGNGDNWPMINFFKFNDIAYYRFMDDEISFNKVKNKISNMPVYPQKGSIQKFENVIIVKFSQEKGFSRYEWEK